VSGPVKRARLGEAWKPGEPNPANPDCVGDGSGAVGPPARVFWCERHPEATPALMCRRVYEHLVTGCIHESDAHCPACAMPHLRDLVLTLGLGGEANPRTR